MRPAASRLLTSGLLAGAFAAAARTGGTAGAAPSLPPVPPPCGAQLAARFTDTATVGAAHRMTIVLTNSGRTPCAIVGFPALVVPSAPGNPLPVGHLTGPHVIELSPGAAASFELRYATSQAAAPAPCSLSVTVNETSAAAQGTIPLAACASITQFDVTSFGRGVHGLAVPPAPPPVATLPVCLPSELHLREVRIVPPGTAASRAGYVLQNWSAAPCRIGGGAALRLLDADAKAITIRFVPRRTMAQMLALAPGAEASLTAVYELPIKASCPPARIAEIILAPDPTPVAAPATIMACDGGLMRVTDLRIGVPLPPGLLPG